MKGGIGMSATTSEKAEGVKESESEVIGLLGLEQEIEFVTTGKNKARAGGAFFPCLYKAIFDLYKYGVFKSVDRNNYTHNCLCLALKSRGVTRY